MFSNRDPWADKPHESPIKYSVTSPPHDNVYRNLSDCKPLRAQSVSPDNSSKSRSKSIERSPIQVQYSRRKEYEGKIESQRTQDLVQFREKLLPDYQGLRTKANRSRESGGYVKHPERGSDTFQGGAGRQKVISKSIASVSDIYGNSNTHTQIERTNQVLVKSKR